MPMLTDDQLETMTAEVLAAALADDRERIIEAIRPLWTGDIADSYMFVIAMIQVVLGGAGPAALCAEHDGCACIEFDLYITTHEENSPVFAAYLEMLGAEYTDADTEVTLQMWCDAITGDTAAELLWLAIRTAGQVTRQRIAGQQ